MAEAAAGGAKSASLLRNSALVGIGTGLSRVTGFARTSALLYALGALAAADAYNLANTTPNIVYELILGGVLTATLVPLFVDAAKSGDDDATNAVVTAAFCGLVVLTIIAIVAAPLILWLYTWRKPDGEAITQARLALPLMRLFLPQILFYGLTAVGTSLLNARRSFLAPAFAPVLNNLFVIGVLVWFAQTVGSDPTVDEIANDTSLVLLLGLGTTFGIAIMTVALWPALKASGASLRWNFSLRHPAVRSMARLSGWTMGYAVANQISLVVVLGLAGESDGWVTAYAAAFIFFQLPHGLFAVSIMTTFMPELASASSAGDTVEFRRRFAQGARLMSLLVLPASVGYFLLAEPIVSLLKGGSFDAAGVELVAAVLANFALGLLALSIYVYVLRAFYAMKDTRTPFLINVGQNVCNIVLALLLVGPLGVEGLALAYSISYIIGAIAALAILRHRLGGIEGRSLGSAFAKMAVATAMMAGVVVLAGSPISIDTRLGALAHTAVAVVAGALAYAAVAFALGVTELRDLGQRLRKR